MKTILKTSVVLILVWVVFGLSVVAYADRDDYDRGGRGDRGDRHDRGDNRGGARPDYRWDNRYRHDRRYPRDGYIVRSLPERHRSIHYHDRNYFYFGGVWYLPSGPNFVVVRPPIGIVVPILPPLYTTVWFQGVPYYYANEVYYLWRPDLNAYQVTTPPSAESQPEPPYMADELFIYPKQGQSEQKQADDRYACHRWGVDQSGYDPTQPPGSLPVNELNRLRSDYNRAMKACLEGRGYSVR